jgi:hypothetical protein
VELRLHGGHMLLSRRGARGARAVLGMVGFSLLSLVACGDEGDGKDDDGEEQEGEKIDPSTVDVSVDPNQFPTVRFDTFPKPYEDPQACIDFGATMRQDTSTRSSCLCENCLEIMQECDALPGCPEIRACAWRTGCKTEWDCYLTPGPKSCAEVIDRYGNGSVAVAVSIELLDCTDSSDCK